MFIPVPAGPANRGSPLARIRAVYPKLPLGLCDGGELGENRDGFIPAPAWGAEFS